MVVVENKTLLWNENQTRSLRLMLELSSADYFAQGGQRACYFYPERSTLCIKIELHEGPESDSRVKEELDAHERVILRGQESRALSFYRGTVETNLGKGYLFDLVREKDGGLSPTLWAVRSQIDDALLGKLAAEFYLSCLTHDYVVGDTHSKNLVVQNRERLVLVDGLGAVDYRWFYYLAKPCRIWKLNRKLARFCCKQKIPFDFKITLLDYFLKRKLSRVE